MALDNRLAVTNPVPFKAAELINDFHRRVPVTVEAATEQAFFAPHDTTCWTVRRRGSDIDILRISSAENDLGTITMTGFASLPDVRPHLNTGLLDTWISVIMKRRLERLATNLALNSAVTLLDKEVMTQSVPGEILQDHVLGILGLAGQPEFRGVAGFIGPSQIPTEIMGVNLSDQTARYCVSHRMLEHLEQVIVLVRESFPSINDLSVGLETDMESKEQWVSIDAQIIGQPEEFLRRYDEYSHRFVRMIPWPARNKIRFNYDLI
jgi:hypothetical protein